MDVLNNLTTRFNGWLSRVSRTSRIAVVVLLMLVVIVILNNSGLSRAPEMVELLPEMKLRKAEVRQICIELDANSLCDYQVHDNMISVPAKQRSTYLKTVADADLIRDEIRQSAPTQLVNPFLNRTQQQQLAMQEKKRVVRNLVLQLPFVEDAAFEMDVQQSGSAFEPAKKSALVSVEPENGQCLNRQQIITLRNHISGALAEFSSDDIVITDLNAGRTYVANDLSGMMPRDLPNIPASVSSATIELAAGLENEIRGALSEFAGLEIDVDVQEIRRFPDRIAARAVSTGSQAPPVGRQQSSMPLMQAGTNDQVSIENDTAGVAQIADQNAPQVEHQVFVSVSVPQGLVETHFNMDPPKEFLGFPLEELDPAILESNFEAMKQNIIAKVRTLLPPASFQNPAGYPVQVTLERNNGQAADVPVAMQVQRAVSRHWPTAATLLIGCVMLMVVLRSGNRRIGPQSAEAVAVEAPESSDEDTAAARQLRNEAKQQLTQLIQEDPDKAAEVIKSWIRDAA